VNGEKKKKVIRTINIDADKCNGCRACEMICSAFHASPKYSSTNPARSRISVNFDPLNDIYIPVMAGEYTASECHGRYTIILDGKKYKECAFCRASCPSRDIFKEPDSGLPLSCDLCEDLEDPSLHPDIRRKGGGDGRRRGAGRFGDRIGSISGQVWIGKDNGYRCPNVNLKEGLKHCSRSGVQCSKVQG